MKGSMSTDLGIITVNPEVIAKYAGTVAVECFGIVGMAAVNMKDGLVRLLKKDSLTHGIQVTISDDNRITIDFHVIVSYGVSISAVTDNLISNVKYRVEEFSGMPVDKINIYGATGGRLDHLLANIFLVLGPEFEHLAAKVRLFDCQNSVSFYLPGEYQLLKEAQMTYLAFIPLTAVKDLSLFNTKYRLAKAKFNRPISLASNEFMEEKAHFAFSEGVVCVIQSRD